MAYFTAVREAIHKGWDYPKAALDNYLEGLVVLEFVILADGQLEDVWLVRSSGYSVLDEEALRAVRATAPFRPIPPGTKNSRLKIVANFDYVDNRRKRVMD
jgi:protein TonB